MGPSLQLSPKNRVLWVPEEMAEKAVDGEEGRGLYPAPHRKRGGFRAGTDAADKPAEHLLFLANLSADV